MKNKIFRCISGPALAFALNLVVMTVWAEAHQNSNPDQGKTVAPPILSPLEDAVRHELMMLPYYGVFDNLTFRVDGDKVELSGQVRQPTLAIDAKRAVERVKGVSQVVNHIEVLPLSSFDDRIRLMTYRKIYGDSAMTLYWFQPVPPIRIIVKSGNVTLEGSVSRSMDKVIANMDANQVLGVFSVTNNLKVQS
jgi:hyperosmotically inducible periplasmic protein